MDQDWVFNARKDAKKFIPNPPLVVDVIRPETILGGRITASDANTNQVIEVAVRQPLYIDVNRCAFNVYFWATDDVDLLLPDGQCPQRMAILFWFGVSIGLVAILAAGATPNAAIACTRF